MIRSARQSPFPRPLQSACLDHGQRLAEDFRIGDERHLVGAALRRARHHVEDRGGGELQGLFRPQTFEKASEKKRRRQVAAAIRRPRDQPMFGKMGCLGGDEEIGDAAFQHAEC